MHATIHHCVALAIPENHVVSFVLLLCELAGNFQSNIPAARAHVAVHRPNLWVHPTTVLYRSKTC